MVIYNKLSNRGNYGAWRDTDVIKFIVMHYTGNDGDTAKANCNYFANNVVKASANYFVDDNSVYRSVPDDYVAWSVGGSKYSDCATTGGGKFHGQCTNTNSISIEMCDTVRDGRIDVSDATLKNAVELCRMLMNKYNVPISRVICHFDVTGKACPNFGNGSWIYGERKDWKKFKELVVNGVLTEADVERIVKNILAGYNTKPSKWAKDEGTIEKAKELGITVDGERPQGYTKREETMQMLIKLAERLGLLGDDGK